jgi:hypothetical protein
MVIRLQRVNCYHGWSAGNRAMTLSMSRARRRKYTVAVMCTLGASRLRQKKHPS